MLQNIRTHGTKAAVALSALTSIVFLGGVAGATPADPTTTGFSDLTTKVGDIAPLFFGLAVLLIGIALAYRWMRKGSKAS